MNIQQINEFINKGNAALLLVAIAFILLLIYLELSRRPHRGR